VAVFRPSQSIGVIAGGFQGSIDFGTAGILTSQGGSDVFVAAFDENTGQTLWAKSFGDAQNQSAVSVALDKSTSSVFVAGQYEGSPAFGTVTLPPFSPPTSFLASLDGNSGTPQWATAIASTTVTQVTGGLSSVYLTGILDGTAGDVAFAGYDSTGALVFRYVYGDKNEQRGYSIASQDDSLASEYRVLAIAGSLDGEIDIGTGPHQSVGAGDSAFVGAFTLKSSVLTPRWLRVFGIDAAATRPSPQLAVEPLGDHIYVAGNVVGSIDFGNGPLPVPSSGAIYVAQIGY
jgi:hypothetical protein